MKKIFAGGALTAVALGGMIAMAPTASAHHAEASATCEGGVVVDLWSYYDGADLEVKIDDEVVESKHVGQIFKETYSFGDLTTGHTWSVTVDAQGDKYDLNESGSVEACEQPAPEPTETPEPTPEPTVPAETPTPDATVPADEPTEPAEEPSPEPSTAAPVEDDDSELAATGATVGGAAAFALLLVGGGAALVIARKRMAKN